MRIKKTHLWPTPLWECLLSFDRNFNLKLWNEEIVAIDPALASTEFNLLDHAGPLLTELKNACIASADAVLSEYGKSVKGISRAWVNCDFPGENIPPHSHFVELVGVYYLSATENSSELCLLDPSPGTKISSKTGDSSHKIKPEEGKLVLFPGLVNHYVPPGTDGQRISIAMNFILQ